MPQPVSVHATHADRAGAVRVIRRLREAGFTAYLAGGCVRDRLLGHEPQDHDVATDARPEQVRRVWRNARYVGEAFGVVLARVGDASVEVATFRREAGYDDHRRPTRVEFTDAREDAIRRDFTINGLFEDPPLGDPPDPRRPADVAAAAGSLDDGAVRRTLDDGSVLIDYVGGLADLAAGVVRAIGEPSQRFDEDYLRMLRAVRFAARFGFTIDDATARAIGPLARFLGSISRERIGEETRRMLTGPRPAAAAALCQELRLDGPTLNEDHAAPEPAALAALERDGAAAPLPVALAAWMLDRHAPGGGLDGLVRFARTDAGRVVQRWRKALCLSNREREETAAVLRHAAHATAWGEMDRAHRKRLLAERSWQATRRLLAAAGGAALVESIDRDAPPLCAEGLRPEPLLGGDDLIRLGLRPGPAFKRLLRGAYNAQLNGELHTRDDAEAWVRRHANSSHRSA